MEFGLFIQMYTPKFRREEDPDAEHTSLLHDLETVIAADKAGFKYVWATEHHFLDEYSHLSANDTVLDGSYTPLSRPLFLYVKAGSLKRPEVKTFIRYCLREASRVAQAVGYIPLPSDLALFTQERLAKNTEGSIRSIGQPVGPLRTLMPK